jgi:hypothetical protein
MNQSRLIRLLVQPSLSSATLVLSLTAAVVGSSAYAYVNSKQLFYEYVFGAYGFKTYIWQQSESLSTLKNTVLNSPAAYYVLVGLAATAVGVMVYAILQFLGMLFSWRHWSGLDALGPNRQAIARELTRRLLLRILVLAGWAVFGACFFALVLPSVALLTQGGVEHLQLGPSLIGVLDCAAAALILAFCLHIQVIFLRLALLRPRVFFSVAAAEEIEAKGR